MKSEKSNSSIEIWRLVTSIYRKWYREAEKRLINNGLSIMEYRILKRLVENGAQPMVKLAESNMITQGWVTSLVDRLEMKSYVERIRSNTDRRVVNIAATAKGTEFYRKIMELHEEFIAKTLNFMEPKELDVLRGLLSRVEEQLLSSPQLLDEISGTDIKSTTHP